MKEHVNQQIKSENAKRHEYGKRHGSLNRTGTSLAADSLKIGEGAEKSGGLHQEFVKEVSFRKGITFYTFLIKTRRICSGSFSYRLCLWLGRERVAQTILS